MIRELLDRVAANPSYSLSTMENDNPTIEPLVSGYMYFILILPDEIYKKYSDVSDSSALIINCISAELPDININAVERKGIGGSYQIIPSSVSRNQTINVRFYETKRADIINLLKIWTNSIFDPNTGMMKVAPKKSKYTATGVLVVSNQEMSFYNARYGVIFNGLWPNILPQSNLNPDITTNNVVELNVGFNYDTMYDLREFLYTYGKEKFNQFSKNIKDKNINFSDFNIFKNLGV